MQPGSDGVCGTPVPSYGLNIVPVTLSFHEMKKHGSNLRRGKYCEDQVSSLVKYLVEGLHAMELCECFLFCTCGTQRSPPACSESGCVASWRGMAAWTPWSCGKLVMTYIPYKTDPFGVRQWWAVADPGLEIHKDNNLTNGYSCCGLLCVGQSSARETQPGRDIF